MDNETMQDLIIHAYEQKPLEFQSSFNDLIADRIVKAVDIKKIEVAQSMFSDQPASEDYESESDQEEQENGTTA
jgi:hypothetical protein